MPKYVLVSWIFYDQITNFGLFICYTSYILSFKVRIILVYSKILSKKGRGSQSDKKNVM